jgi:hypothetical protein
MVLIDNYSILCIIVYNLTGLSDLWLDPTSIHPFFILLFRTNSHPYRVRILRS